MAHIQMIMVISVACTLGLTVCLLMQYFEIKSLIKRVENCEDSILGDEDDWSMDYWTSDDWEADDWEEEGC